MLQVTDEVKRLKKDGVKRQFNPLKDSTGIRFKPYDPHGFHEDLQIELLHRCKTQEWVGICDVILKGFDRSVVSLQKIKKDDVIIDYHGLVITPHVPIADYCKKDGVKWEYCMEVMNAPKYIIDATSDNCIAHPGHRCMGRLCNHADQRKGLQANMTMTDITLKALPDQPRIVAFRARHPIEPFQQLRFDYHDKVARELFGKN